MRAGVVAVAVVVASPAIPVLAQKSSAVQPSWTVIAVKDVPSKVRDAVRRAMPRSRVTKVERAGIGAKAIYRVSMTGKRKEATFTAAGKLVK